MGTKDCAVVAGYVPVHCRPEMRHVHRQITGLNRGHPHVITQRRESPLDFPHPPTFANATVEKPSTGRTGRLFHRLEMWLRESGDA
jgi:hypothetical protein